MPGNWNHRQVVITGGTGALGEAVVRLLADLGAQCHVTTSRRGDAAVNVPADGTLHQIDLSDEAAVVALYAQLDRLWASIHLVGGFAMSPIADTKAEDLRKMFEINTMTCFLCAREAVKAFRRNSSPLGGGRESSAPGPGSSGGRIINVAARPALSPSGGAGMIAYTASKAAVASITQCLAEEVKAEGILVNAVVPSLMDTPANRKGMPKADFSTWPKVQDVAHAIAFLAGPDNVLTSGALVPVYGKV